MDIFDEIRKYVPFNEQEEKDQKMILLLENSGLDLYARSTDTAHLTASAWVVSPDHTKVLMAYHNIYRSWAWLGGHADGEHNLFSVAEKEVREESGLSDFQPVSDQIYSLEVLTVDGHVKKGEYVSSHLHLNVTYLFEADPSLPVHHNPDENQAVAWFDLEEVYEKSAEPWMTEHIYRKLNEKLTSFPLKK